MTRSGPLADSNTAMADLFTCALIAVTILWVLVARSQTPLEGNREYSASVYLVHNSHNGVSQENLIKRVEITSEIGERWRWVAIPTFPSRNQAECMDLKLKRVDVQSTGLDAPRLAGEVCQRRPNHSSGRFVITLDRLEHAVNLKVDLQGRDGSTPLFGVMDAMVVAPSVAMDEAYDFRSESLCNPGQHCKRATWSVRLDAAGSASPPTLSVHEWTPKVLDYDEGKTPEAREEAIRKRHDEKKRRNQRKKGGKSWWEKIFG